MSGAPTIDLNADLGEAVDDGARAAERALMGLVTSVNIACGGHTGDASSMRASLITAGRHGCAAGAHPSYPDRANYGRVPVVMAPDELSASLREQIGALDAIARGCGVPLRHVKPHGALYHAAAEDETTARAVFEAAESVDPTLRLIGPAGSPALAWWAGWGAAVGAEGFADRVYEPDGRLRSRALAGAMIGSPQAAAAQALEIALRGRVVSSDGTTAPVPAETICLHGDSPGALSLARAVAGVLQSAGVGIRALGTGDDADRHGFSGPR
ncbi:MAG: 5-oxoprolinase subunit PxpA [Phycisphaerales bacterium]|nr:5-oxoprolinase subunit PxpA [Planctomycetota bacterium]MCH8508928.1 5-oxoprolinase subunit PxpA [Phycisphaerales bacterium]